MKISPMSAHDLGDLNRLCDQELTLDRGADLIPRIVTQRPYLGLVAADRASTVGACIGSVAEDHDGPASISTTPQQCALPRTAATSVKDAGSTWTSNCGRAAVLLRPYSARDDRPGLLAVLEGP